MPAIWSPAVLLCCALLTVTSTLGAQPSKRCEPLWNTWPVDRPALFRNIHDRAVGPPPVIWYPSCRFANDCGTPQEFAELLGSFYDAWQTRQVREPWGFKLRVVNEETGQCWIGTARDSPSSPFDVAEFPSGIYQVTVDADVHAPFRSFALRIRLPRAVQNNLLGEPHEILSAHYVDDSRRQFKQTK
jgi:hypothetical protein